MTQTAKPEITASAIYRVTAKSDGRECYMVPSDSQPGLFYQTCWNAETNNWDCTCRHGQVQATRGQSAYCKHTRAAQVAINARANQLREQAEAARIERERRYAEADAKYYASSDFEFQCGTYNHPWN